MIPDFVPTTPPYLLEVVRLDNGQIISSEWFEAMRDSLGAMVREPINNNHEAVVCDVNGVWIGSARKLQQTPGA